jgi:hypothetical protein
MVATIVVKRMMGKRDKKNERIWPYLRRYGKQKMGGSPEKSPEEEEASSGICI